MFRLIKPDSIRVGPKNHSRHAGRNLQSLNISLRSLNICLQSLNIAIYFSIETGRTHV